MLHAGMGVPMPTAWSMLGDLTQFTYFVLMLFLVMNVRKRIRDSEKCAQRGPSRARAHGARTFLTARARSVQRTRVKG